MTLATSVIELLDRSLRRFRIEISNNSSVILYISRNDNSHDLQRCEREVYVVALEARERIGAQVAGTTTRKDTNQSG